MEGLLSLLLFAAFFYFMMRFGCGAHMVHGHAGHGGHGERGEHGTHAETSRAVDPVCGMEVSAGQGYTKMHAGREYRLCSRVCLDKFDANPERYASALGGSR
jgi:YHS domain-containing protein